MSSESETELAAEASRRRTFAIISHPDAGKTTLTEKLLLYGGAIHMAGAVKSRKASRHAVSDWMKMEQERGISITSSVLQFDYLGRRLNLLDTPGHADFSEDTYRVLAAVDCAVMLVDNAKGVEERTRKLFDVCRLRGIPVLTFINKCDRDGIDPRFSGFVFKIQANMNPRHRDRVAFIRVQSGKFERGMDVRLHRTGDTIRLAKPHSFLASERVEVEEAWPGDVIGLFDPGNLRIGDTLLVGEPVDYAGIPRFAPEHFGRIKLKDPLKRKHLQAGLHQLAQEGAIQLFIRPDVGDQDPYLGAVGQLQFEVLLHRLENEYGAKAVLDASPFRYARWIGGDPKGLAWLRARRDYVLVDDRHGRPVVLSESIWPLQYALRENPGMELYEVEPL